MDIMMRRITARIGDRGTVVQYYSTFWQTIVFASDGELTPYTQHQLLYPWNITLAFTFISSFLSRSQMIHLELYHTVLLIR